MRSESHRPELRSRRVDQPPFATPDPRTARDIEQQAVRFICRNGGRQPLSPDRKPVQPHTIRVGIVRLNPDIPTREEGACLTEWHPDPHTGLVSPLAAPRHDPLLAMFGDQQDRSRINPLTRDAAPPSEQIDRPPRKPDGHRTLANHTCSPWPDHDAQSNAVRLRKAALLCSAVARLSMPVRSRSWASGGHAIGCAPRNLPASPRVDAPDTPAIGASRQQVAAGGSRASSGRCRRR
jgi:hypothetical protein